MPTVLVVDDEPIVLKVLVRLLSAGGYATVTAKHGEEAWAYLQRPARAVDLLITDVVMPHMTGTELAARVKERYPELPIVLMSAYSDDALIQRGLAITHGHFLSKPFEPDHLLWLVAQVLPPGSSNQLV